jgi:hypothetical protein
MADGPERGRQVAGQEMLDLADREIGESRLKQTRAALQLTNRCAQVA